ncbi:MAG TPA: hypothetical protein VKE71_05090, partial [Candidatus Angelobacter sp.]|nr:hypothetical protein [Candidatus Angelobacter sp.]
AALLALDFRYRHPDVAHENEPYHVHTEGAISLLPGKQPGKEAGSAAIKDQPQHVYRREEPVTNLKSNSGH